MFVSNTQKTLQFVDNLCQMWKLKRNCPYLSVLCDVLTLTFDQNLKGFFLTQGVLSRKDWKGYDLYHKL